MKKLLFLVAVIISLGACTSQTQESRERNVKYSQTHNEDPAMLLREERVVVLDYRYAKILDDNFNERFKLPNGAKVIFNYQGKDIIKVIIPGTDPLYLDTRGTKVMYNNGEGGFVTAYKICYDAGSDEVLVMHDPQGQLLIGNDYGYVLLSNIN